MTDIKKLHIGIVGALCHLDPFSMLSTMLHEKIKDEVILVTDEDLKRKQLQDSELAPFVLDTPSYADFSIPISMPYVGAEKKRTKPCVKHEYTESWLWVDDQRVSQGWKCRHCEHPLK